MVLAAFWAIFFNNSSGHPGMAVKKGSSWALKEKRRNVVEALKPTRCCGNSPV
jgi:hypothetical protein